MLKTKRLFLSLMALALIGMFSAYSGKVQADKIPLCEYLWGITPQNCKYAFQASHAGNGGGWRPRCFIYDNMKWNRYMVKVDTELLTSAGESWLQKLKEKFNKDDVCACEINFRCEKTQFVGGIGGHYESTWIEHKCDNITINEIRSLIADTNGNFSPGC
ncbi:MAG: hypothetical protein OXF60_03570 [Gammaproteobacteria bacterium]|nr:hypothetical protein [Gammaproteobacteria bacterium]MCY4217682.1 hypothetical protein [Gammaproteobacteria bacterium]